MEKRTASNCDTNSKYFNETTVKIYNPSKLINGKFFVYLVNDVSWTTFIL